MNKVLMTALAAVSLPLAGCTTYDDNSDLATIGTGVGLGAAGGAGVAAIAGGNPLVGAAIGAAVGGLAGAVYADRNNDGYADGYVYNGQYYEGQPAGYQTAAAPAQCGPDVGRSAAIGAVGGAALGAGVSAIAGTGLLASAAIGAAVGGLGGAVWANSNNDGCVDGYVREGQYYSGSPMVQPTGSTSYTGERG